MHNLRLSLLICLATLFTLSACAPDGEGSADNTENGDSYVKRLHLVVRESFPVQVTATLEGTLPDTCMRIQSVDQRRFGDEIGLELRVSRDDTGRLCQRRNVSFDHDVRIQTNTLFAGQYTVRIGNLKKSFEYR